MGKKAQKLKIEDRPEGTRDEDILWLRRDLNWNGRAISQALGICPATVSKVLRQNGITGGASS